MIAIMIAVLALLGISLNLAFAGTLMQPDWALALLLASLLAHRHNWVWVLPGALIHDVVLYWSFSLSFIIMALLPLAMIYLDQHLGAGLPQRLVLMLAAVLLSLLWPGWGLPASLLTLCLCIPIWHVLTRQYAQQAV
ncbi:MAG: hypothetical protein Q9M82_02850 [Mariprofundus sp.]|nr:hypothetical protein [Mariprofundus sp.]